MIFGIVGVSAWDRRPLRAARTHAGLTQEAIAIRAGLDRSFDFEVESAKHSVTLDRAWGNADALGLPVNALFDDPSFSPPKDRSAEQHHG